MICAYVVQVWVPSAAAVRMKLRDVPSFVSDQKHAFGWRALPHEIRVEA